MPPTEHLPTCLIRPIPGYLDRLTVTRLAAIPTQRLKEHRARLHEERAHAGRGDRRDQIDSDIEACNWVLGERRPASDRLREARHEVEMVERELAQLRVKMADAEARLLVVATAAAKLETLLGEEAEVSA